jgi:hypothetical protein
MKRQFISFGFFLQIFISSVYCQASVAVDKVNENFSAQTYVDVQDLVISDEGLFLIEGDEMVPLKSIEVDEMGFFVRKFFFGKCWNGHPVVHPASQGGCNGCEVFNCPFACRCF